MHTYHINSKNLPVIQFCLQNSNVKLFFFVTSKIDHVTLETWTGSHLEEVKNLNKKILKLLILLSCFHSSGVYLVDQVVHFVWISLLDYNYQE